MGHLPLMSRTRHIGGSRGGGDISGGRLGRIVAHLSYGRRREEEQEEEEKRRRDQESRVGGGREDEADQDASTKEATSPQ